MYSPRSMESVDIRACVELDLEEGRSAASSSSSVASSKDISEAAVTQQAAPLLPSSTMPTLAVGAAVATVVVLFALHAAELTLLLTR